MKPKKKVLEILKKRENLYNFANYFLDGFLPKEHYFIQNPIKRKRLRIYIGISFILPLFFLSRFILLDEQGSFSNPIVYVYFSLLAISLIFNFSTQFRYFEFFLFFLLFLGIGINFYLSIEANTFPPINVTFLMVFILLLHLLLNRWISLFYIVGSILLCFFLLLNIQIDWYNTKEFEKSFRYFYNFVMSSLILWILLEFYEHFKEELEKKLKEINSSREKDLQLAREIQSQLYPVIPNNEYFFMDYYIQPFDKVSGDYLDIIERDSGIWIFLADVTGHGLQSAMLTMQINTLVNYLIVEKNIQDLQEVYFELNSHYYKLLQKLNIKNFSDLMILKIKKNQKIEITGSMNLLYYYKAEEDSIISFKEPAPLLGIINFKNKSQIKIKEIEIKKKDVLFICTDGLLEIFGEDSIKREELFTRILQNSIKKNYSNLKIENLIKEIKSNLKNIHRIDDISAILIQKKK
ncbi:MAG: PP2C family protein-serine/threonine phosphatase [Leptonema sp. (in: bacteria)]